VKIDEARIVYICKSNMFMAEVPLQMWDVERELKLLEAAWAQYQKDGTLPAKIPSDDPVYWQCSYCSYRSICREMKSCDCQYCQAIMANDPTFDVKD